jgi:hypothetical protein
VGYETNHSQIFRGVNVDLGCDRHFKVFDNFKIIPENCFGCYKVYVEPRTVVELIKLLLVFDSLKIPNDNVRKCMVEVRPGISGAYKGYLYCRGLEEGEILKKSVAAIVSEKISSEIPVSIKRGCSEFSMAYPSYGYIKDGSTPPMSYKKQWREKEIYTDEHLVTYQYPLFYDTYNHSGLTLLDAFVFHVWVGYAAAIGDLSYLTLSKSP